MTPASPIDSASSWLWWSNFVYVCGAVLTFVAAMIVFIERRLIAAGKREKAMLVTEFFAVGAVILSFIGTCGAIYFGSVVSHLKDDDLTTYKKSADLQIAQANSNSADAEKKAEESRKAAEEARQRAEAARQRAEGIRASAEDARRNSLKAESDAEKSVIDKEKILAENLQLQKQVEDERMARAQIEQRLAPRNLSGPAQQQMVAQLRPVLRQTVDIVLYPGNPESDNLARQIAYAFQQIGWEFHFAQPMGGSVQGVRIEYDGTDEAAKKAAGIIAALLPSSGIQITGDVSSLVPFQQEIGAYVSDGKAGNGKIRIFVGSKPQ